MKSSLLLPIMLLSATGAWYVSLNNPRPATSTPKAPVTLTQAQESPAEKSRPAMWTDNSSIYMGEVFTLNFKTPHAQFLGVTDPGGHFFYVIFPKAYASEGLQPFISGEDFSSKKQITIDPATFYADPYTYGVMENRKVFTRSGTYTFIMGENLHVDDPALVQKVTIQYQAIKRPANAVASTR